MEKKYIKQREVYRKEISEEAKRRINSDCCPVCNTHKSLWSRRKEWRCCSKECSKKFWEEYVIIFDWGSLRLKCLERDNYACIRCGEKYKDVEPDTYKCNMVIDHILPIALGGNEFDISNLQTLCLKCNKIKTVEDIKKIANLRDIVKKQSNGQKILVDFRGD